MSDRVVVAMSGGVDSSVAALLLAKRGFSLLGISMQVWDYRQHGGCSTRATCCAPDDFTDARKVADRIGIPYYVFDFENSFRREVIDKFRDTYAAGETPNPCVDCNQKVKFVELRNRASALGCAAVATGHYAQIDRDTFGYHLRRAVDSNKDQSYFLYGLTQDELSRTIFPVGHMHKEDVRELAREAGLVTASKPESQDICFVSGSVPDFLVKIGAKLKDGEIVDKAGGILGKHAGIEGYTVGQRRGIALGGHEKPLYVIGIDPQKSQVIVGYRSELDRETFAVKDLRWVAPDYQGLSEGHSFQSMVQVRHRHRALPATVTIKGELAQVNWHNANAVVSPGQAAVFYCGNNSEVLGGGRIVR